MTTSSPDLTARKIIVLGANHPVAAAVALALAKAGADVAVTSSNGEPEEAFELRPLRRQIEAEGRQAIADIADLGNGSSVQIAVRQIVKQLGRIDVALVCAGEVIEKSTERMSDSEWSRAIAYNLGAYFYAARAVKRELEDNEVVDGVRGRIVALLPPFRVSAGPVEAASRAGVCALMQGLSEEWHDQGVRVDLIDASSEEEAVSKVLGLISADADGWGA